MSQLASWHLVMVGKEHHVDQIIWCLENIGARWEAIGGRTGKWTCFWDGFNKEGGRVNYRFHFERESDALLFTLRWL